MSTSKITGDAGRFSTEMLSIAKDVLAMRFNPPRDWYLPKDADLVEIDTPGVDGLTIYAYDGVDKNGKKALYGIAFYGRSNKPLWTYKFRDERQREQQIEKTIEQYKSVEDSKRQRRKERSEYRHDYKVGDILVSSWGYDQTNIDYYEVVGTTEKAITIREIGSKVVGDAMTQNVVAPDKGRFKGKAMRKIPNARGSVKINSFAYAYKWDGKPDHETKLEFGH